MLKLRLKASAPMAKPCPELSSWLARPLPAVGAVVAESLLSSAFLAAVLFILLVFPAPCPAGVRWTENGVAVSTAANDQARGRKSPPTGRAAPSSPGLISALVATTDIYAQRLDADGAYLLLDRRRLGRDAPPRNNQELPANHLRRGGRRHHHLAGLPRGKR